MRKLVMAFALGLLVLAASPARAETDRIVAVVNDQVITLNQLNARVALNLRQLGLEKANDQQRSAVLKRTLSGMIDEELQRQYASHSGLNISKNDLAAGKDTAMRAVGGADAWAKLTHGLDQTAQEKLVSEVRWERIMARDVRPRVEIGTAEVDRLIAELAKSRHVLEREISIIQLNPTDSASDKTLLSKMQDLKDKIAKGEDFAAMARAYSEDKSAANGGNLGWFAAGELNPQLEEALDKMQPGNVSEPIRTPIGWYLVKLDNVRTTKPVETEPVTQLELFMLAAPAPSDTKVLAQLNAQLDKTVSNVRKAKDVRAYFDAKQFATSFPQSSALGWILVEDLDSGLQAAVKGVSPGEWSKALNVNGNLARIYVADTRQVLPARLNAYRQKVLDNLFANRLELESRRFMQSLRQKAFVDVRL